MVDDFLKSPEQVIGLSANAPICLASKRQVVTDFCPSLAKTQPTTMINAKRTFFIDVPYD
ncbi:hypothetical protein [Sulfurospirillum diekertiae]|uniref:hypothetical protein n=1 Tax=Sulfurospirillum diekertiae TaxID=1854492 RepID=UPI0010FEA240|nr:hypothetical protein [Sulfurospirillum diekertiae]